MVAIGEISVRVKADESQLNRDLQQLPEKVDAAARKATEKARVTVRGYTDPALGLSGNQLAELRSNAVEKRLADVQRRQGARAEREIVDNQVRARLAAEGKDPSKFLKPDAADRQFSKFIADRNAGDDAQFKQFIEQRNARRQQRFEDWKEGLRRNGPELSDRARMGGGSYTTPQGGGMGKLGMAAGGIVLGMAAAAIGDAVGAAMKMPGINARRDIEIGRLDREGGLLRNAGLSDAAIGMQKNAASLDADLEKINSTAIGRFVGEMTGATASLEAHSRALKAGAAAVEESNRNFRQLGIRVAEYTFGSKTDPTKVLAERQKVELADFEERAAKRRAASPNSVDVISALAQERVRLKFSQQQEREFAQLSYDAQLGSQRDDVAIARLGVGRAQAELRGSNRDAFIADRAAGRLKMESDYKLSLVNMTEDQKRIAADEHQAKLEQYDLQSTLGARNLIENPGMASATSNTEGLSAWFDRGSDVQQDIKGILERILEAMATQSL
jgi:hypothetical protein